MSPKLTFPTAAALSVLTIAAAHAAPGKGAKPVKHTPMRPVVAPTVTKENGAVGLTLSMDKNTYAAAAAPAGGAPAPAPQIHATLTFFNHSQAPLRLYISGAATQWQILDAQGQTVWDYSVGRLVAHNIHLVVLTNSQLSYPQVIPLQTQNGAPLAPGRYTLRGAIPGASGATASLDFTVTR